MRTRTDWPKCAAALAGIVPRRRLHPSVLAWAERSPADEPWLIAFSGGADSLALLLLVWAHWPERRKRLWALHFNHRLRGRAAAVDAQFCRTVCAALKVRYRQGQWDAARPDASEAEARAARQAFFTEETRRAKGFALWFGHQLDDVAETLFMRLARGSGLGGLAAPRPVQHLPEGRANLRPLLALKKTELVEALARIGGTWREDSTNVGGGFLRNRVRRDVLPVWQATAGDRDALAGAGLSRELIEEDDCALDCWVEEIAPILRDGSLSLRRLAGKPRGVVRRALQLWLGQGGRSLRLSRQAFTALLDDVMARRVTRHSLSAQDFAKIGKRRLVFVKARQKISD